MPTTAIDKQASFSAGEVSPECYGRTDNPAYKMGLKLAKNFIPTKHGALKNRPGTKFVAACKASAGNAPPRLIPFVFSDQQSFLLEVGDHYFRVYTNGRAVQSATAPAYAAGTTYAQNALVESAGIAYVSLVNANTGNTPVSSPTFWKFVSAVWVEATVYGAGEYVLYDGGVYFSLVGSNVGNVPSSVNGAWELLAQFPTLEVVTPWAIADVDRLAYAQSGDVITVVHPNYAPQDINRISNTDWTVTPSLISPPAWPTFWTVTSPSFHIPQVGDVLGNGFTTPVTAYSSAANYPDVSGDQAVAYTTPNVPGAQQDVYFLINPANQPSIGARYPSGETGPLAAPSQYWSLYSFDNAQPYAANMYVWAQDLTIGGVQSLAGVLYQCLIANAGNYPNSHIGSYWQVAGDATHPPRPVTYAITMSLRDPLGVLVESLPTYYTPPGGVFPRFPDRPLALQFNPPALPGSISVAIGGTAYTIEGFNVYEGTNNEYGFIGSMDGSTVSGATAPFFIDQGAAPDFNVVPPAGTNPFLLNPGAETPEYSWPGVVAYFQQRRIFGRSDAKPNAFWGSAIGNFLDFDQPDFITDNDSYEFEIAATKLEEIRSIVPQRELLLFTSSSETVASGSNGGVGGAITPSSIDVRPASQHGSSYLAPVVADHSVLSVTGKGCYIRDLQYDFRSASYTGRDITSLVRHLLDGHTIASWCYAETPDNLIWIVRDDGVALSLTYEQDFQVVAFAQHTTNAAILGAAPGLFQRVCSVPEGTEDAVYFVVQRNINGSVVNYIERLASRFIDGPNGPSDYRQACFLDCALTYNGRNSVENATVTVALDTPRAGQFTVSTSIVSPFTADDAAQNNQVVLHPDGIANPGTDENPGKPLPPVRLRIVAFLATNQVVCELDTPPPANWGLFNAITDWALARKTISGLDALDGCAVGALVDGTVDLGKGGNVVVTGAIALAAPGVDVTIGLPYVSDMQTLDTAADAYKVSQRQVQMVTVEVSKSRGFSAGEDFQHLAPAKPRKVTDGYAQSPLLTELVSLTVPNSWNQSGSICVRMSDPLPLTIVSIIREIAVGGRG